MADDAPPSGIDLQEAQAKYDDFMKGGRTALDVKASRIKWDLGPRFDPSRYFHDFHLLAAFRDPRIMRKTFSESGRGGIVHMPMKELLSLFRKWDKVRALQLRHASLIPPGRRCGLFKVFKDLEWDRLIINPHSENVKNDTISKATKFLGQGAMVCLIHLEGDEIFIMSADDLREFYPTSKVRTLRP